MKKLWDYLHFLLQYPLLLAAIAGMLAGGAWMWTGVAVLAVLAILGDELLPTNAKAPPYRFPALLDAMLYVTLPLIVVLLVVFIWQCVDQKSIPAAGLWLQHLVGWTPGKPPTLIHMIGGMLSIGFMVGISATNVAHELMHRQGNPLALFFGRVLLTFSFDVPLCISHVYGHHVDVGLPSDPTTGRRGESSYAFIWRSTMQGNANAWRIECARQRVKGKSSFSWDNLFLRGHAQALLVAAAAGLVGGWMGAVLFLLCAALAKAILELINYIQHYGIVRQPGGQIGHRHSWNSDKIISSYLLFNGTRHSHHHAEPTLAYWQLKSLPDAPELPCGYLTSVCIALIPPWWHRHMAPALLRWDNTLATDQEKRLAREANRFSGVHRLVGSVESN